MAICITFGTQEFSSRLEGYEQVRAFCYNCKSQRHCTHRKHILTRCRTGGNWDGHCESRWSWITICFLPVIPLSTHKYKEVRCGRCGFTQDLSIRPDITPATRPPPGASWGPAYGHPPQQYSQPYTGPQPPPPAGQQHPTPPFGKMTHPRTRDFIIHPSPTPTAYHIFFLPGNPGLVEYYAGFLQSLHQSLNSTASSKFHVAGYSFGGNKHTIVNDGLHSITEQTDLALEKLRQYIADQGEEEAKEQSTQINERPKVILLGHSFGTFVTTEMIKRISSERFREKYEIIGNVLLFPPIPDLEKSPRGTRVASLARWKYLPNVCSFLARAVYSLPLVWANAVIKHFTAFPPDALETTRAFFGSKTGVAQALYMARLEIDEIKLSRWESAFQYTSKLTPTPRIRIFFGKNDYWVCDELRDAFVYKYCDATGPKAFGRDLDITAEIDPSDDGDEASVMIPHDFSIRHSEHVIPYVARFIEDIINHE
ncbi:hypothetical protein BGW36DRAFT_415591 [Talaromyces proteolyticus]|uniref:Uncharacterized protein n=1 Tax=Talaromyces proteolyticus TaxID=1131652 RepID=A0AAD4KTF2_9EURO|nr:uncharacterized protein BGW36DRAFT_415591 [Talaromyces proteolyticus]KAH8700572.1 hypothetical protein BGW36DRAFT_415591 [Talaromyces proteolyticus]